MHSRGFLASTLYRPANPVPYTLFNKNVAEAAVSPVHLVCMHGLLGNRRHFYSLCSCISGGDSLAQVKLEEKQLNGGTYPAVRWPDVTTNPVFTTPGPLPSAESARVYPSTAFDWRNHGESFHDPLMNLDTLSGDLDQFLTDYVTRFRFSERREIRTPADLEKLPPPTTPTEPLPIVLVAHSMGAMALLHWMWNGHISSWERAMEARRATLAGEAASFDPTVTTFSNPLYKIVGAVVLDMAPARRPPSFNETIKMIEFLPHLPIETCKNQKEAEKWLLEHGPKELFNEHNIWQIRFHLSNIDFSKVRSGGIAEWKTGLQPIIRSLHTILWEEGGMQCLVNARRGLQIKNEMNIKEHKDIWELPPRFRAFPVLFVFGESSPYRSDSSLRSIFRHFRWPYLAELIGCDHFFFMKHKLPCKKMLADFLYKIEKDNNLI